VIRLHRIGEALRSAGELIEDPPVERVDVDNALQRYSARKVVSPIDLPPRPKAVMDGYAVRHVDVEDASQASPAVLKILSGVVRPGADTCVRVGAEEAVRIETGGFIPEGADAVVPVEETEEMEGRLLVFSPVGRFANVSLPGEELRKGARILEKGARIRPWHVAALVACGYSRVDVFKLGAAVIATGDEFLKAGYFAPFTLQLVEGVLAEWGFELLKARILADDVDAIENCVRETLPQAYVTLVLGGSSMGSRDYSVKAVERLSPKYMVHGFALRPGKTACLAVKDGRIVMVMSGLPVAALAVLENVLRPLLEKVVGLELPRRTRVKARLARRVTVKAGLRGFVRVRVYRERGGLAAEPLMVGGSGSLGSLLEGNGFLIVPEDVEGFEEGEEVEVELHGRVG